MADGIQDQLQLGIFPSGSVFENQGYSQEPQRKKSKKRRRNSRRKDGQEVNIDGRKIQVGGNSFNDPEDPHDTAQN